MVKRFAIEQARSRLSAVVDEAAEQPVLLTRRGVPVAAIVTVEQYELLDSVRRARGRTEAKVHREAAVEGTAGAADASEKSHRAR